MIYNYRYKTLKQKSEPIVFPDSSLPELIKTMGEELAKSNGGVGLAANQIGITKQVAYIKFAAHKVKIPMVIHKTTGVGMTDLNRTSFTEMPREIEVPAAEVTLINPEILEQTDEYEVSEGCISYPGIYANIKRFRKVKVKNWTVDGKEEIIEAEGLLAQCIQHEIEHFQGKCFVDKFTPAQRIIYENRIRRIK